MFKDLLEYQKLEAKLLKINREIALNPSRQTLNKLVATIKDEQSKLLELDSKAKSVIELYEKCKKEYEKTYEEVTKLSLADDSLGEEALSKNILELTKLVSSLTTLERTLSSGADSVSGIIKAFEAGKANIISHRTKHKELKEKVENFESTLAPQTQELKAKMQEMEKGINKDLLSKYKHLRQDKIFPVLVPLNKNACGGCSMSLSSAHMNKIKNEGYLECEQCRRYIYLDHD